MSILWALLYFPQAFLTKLYLEKTLFTFILMKPPLLLLLSTRKCLPVLHCLTSGRQRAELKKEINFERGGKECTGDAAPVPSHLAHKVQTHPPHLPGLNAQIWLIGLNAKHLVHWKQNYFSLQSTHDCVALVRCPAQENWGFVVTEAKAQT